MQSTQSSFTLYEGLAQDAQLLHIIQSSFTLYQAPFQTRGGRHTMPEQKDADDGIVYQIVPVYKNMCTYIASHYVLSCVRCSCIRNGGQLSLIPASLSERTCPFERTFLLCSCYFAMSSSEEQTMTQSQSICTRIQRRFAKLFNPAFDNTFKRELFKKGGHELWVLQSWALTHDEYELQWICNCPRDSSKDGQTWTKKQGRHGALGDSMFFLQSVRQDGPMMTEHWVCPGWSCMPRRFVVFIAAVT